MSETGTNRKPILIAGGVIALVVIGVLAFGVFGVQTLFIDKTVDEDNPFAVSSATEAPAAATTASEAEPNTAPATEPAAPADTATAAATPTSTQPVSTEAPAIVTVAQGSFSGADASHDVSGQAIVITDGGTQRFLRFEDFEATNGPDLKVYLRTANDEFISLGDLKGNIGNQNYEIPADVDLAVYNTVQIWCQRFSVSFGQATLT